MISDKVEFALMICKIVCRHHRLHLSDHESRVTTHDSKRKKVTCCMSKARYKTYLDFMRYVTLHYYYDIMYKVSLPYHSNPS